MALLPQVPRPRMDAVASAAGNVAHKVLYGGLADLRPMPRTLVADGELRELYRYRPAAEAPAEQGDPVLLVMPLAAPSLCYDLRRGCSLVEHLVSGGRPTYVVEYGEVAFRNRNLGLEHWIDDVVPEAVRRTSVDAGGRPVHVVAWSLGGIFAALAAAAHADLPIASITVLGSPFDVTQVPLVAPIRPLVHLTDGRIITAAYQTFGGAPKPLVRWAFQLSSVQKLVTKPVAVLTHLNDADYLAQLEAVDRFMHGIVAYPGRSFGQLYHRFLRRNELVGGTYELGERTVRLADIRVPVLVLAGSTDGIAPVASVRHLTTLLTGSPDVRFEVVPGGHLGMLTGRRARETSWRTIDSWLHEFDHRPLPGHGAVPAAAAAAPAHAHAIGANRARRYG